MGHFFPHSAVNSGLERGVGRRGGFSSSVVLGKAIHNEGIPASLLALCRTLMP